MTRLRRGDRASGVLSTTFGVGVFLTLLYFASYLLLNLWLASSVDSVAHDAAIDVATSDPTTTTRAEAEAVAITRARASLGDYGSKVTFVFETSDVGQIVLHVEAPSLKLAPPLVAGAFDIGGYDKRIVVHPESDR